MAPSGASPPGDAVGHNLALQRSYYGEVLGDRVRRLVNTYGVSQSRFAGALGLSPAMLSQVMSGRRAKLANPAVVARMVLLERQARRTDGVGEPRARAATLAEVLAEVAAAADAVVVRAAAATDHEQLVAALRELVPSPELAAAAGAVGGLSPVLAELLDAAARPPRP